MACIFIRQILQVDEFKDGKKEKLRRPWRELGLVEGLRIFQFGPNIMKSVCYLFIVKPLGYHMLKQASHPLEQGKRKTSMNTFFNFFVEKEKKTRKLFSIVEHTLKLLHVFKEKNIVG